MLSDDKRTVARVTLVVDSPYRDLPGMAILAMRLCSNGFQCYLSPYRFQDILETSPDFVLLPYLRTGNQDRVHQIANTGIRVGILDTEGGVAMPGVDTFANIIGDSKSVRQEISLYCAWAQCIADCLVEKGLFNSSQLEVTGTPRMDFYSDPWKDAILEITSEQNDYNDNLILFNGNFGAGNPGAGIGTMTNKMLADAFNPDLANSIESNQKQALRLMANLANKVAARFPESTVVYRPHPFEGLDIYRDLLNSLPNLHLVREGPIYGWILRAKAVIQRGCSTAIEAGIAGVPAFSPIWVPLGWEIPNTDSASVMCESEEVILNSIDDVLNNRFEYPQKVKYSIDQLTRDWFQDCDGKSHQRVSNVITKILSGNGTQISDKKRHQLIQELGNMSAPSSPTLTSRIRKFAKFPLRLLPTHQTDQGKNDEKENHTYLEIKQTQNLFDAIYRASKGDKSLELPSVIVKIAKEVTNHEKPSFEISIDV